MSQGRKSDELKATLGSLRASLITTAVMSGALNVLLLGGSIYMMLIYDSVLPSHSIPTLVGLLILVVIVFAFQAAFDMIRQHLLNDIATSFDRKLNSRVQQVAFEAGLRRPDQPGAAAGAVRDLDNIRGFLASPGPAAFMDLPWILFFFAILTLLHVWLAVTALVGALVMGGLTYATHRASTEPTKTIAAVSSSRNAVASERWRHAEVIHAMGMERRTRLRWAHANRSYLKAQDDLSRTTARMGSMSRVFRLLLQSLILTIGALLVIDGKATGGVIFASSIISARALAPIDQVIAHWRGFAAARDSWGRLDLLMGTIAAPESVTLLLPQPHHTLEVDGLVVTPPGSTQVTARNVSFKLVAGDALGVIGASGSGKSSLIRAIVGAWRAARGTVRFDGATHEQYDHEQLGDYIGYLPQSVELLSGTVAENIARFAADMESAAVVAAAKRAGVHELIVNLPDGYGTKVGPDGTSLSGGQQQRIALARALYRDPFLVVLDEPNSNLDAQGEAALDHALREIRERNGIAIIVAHRAAALNRANKVLFMLDGAMGLFGPRDEVMDRLSARSKQVGDASAPAAPSDDVRPDDTGPDDTGPDDTGPDDTPFDDKQAPV